MENIRFLYYRSEKDNANRLLIYPHPAKVQVNISGLKGNETIQLYDMLGNLVKSEKVTYPTIRISLSQLE